MDTIHPRTMTEVERAMHQNHSRAGQINFASTGHPPPIGGLASLM